MKKMIAATVIAATAGILSTASAQLGNTPWGRSSTQEPRRESPPVRAAAGTQAVALAEGQRLVLRDGGYLTLRRGQLTLVSQAGIAKVFAVGSKLTQDNRGQVGIWGTGGTTIVGTSTVDLRAAHVDPAVRRTVNEKDRSIGGPAGPR